MQVSTTRQAISDRYYRALYAKLHAQELATSSKQTLFLNLLFRSMKVRSAAAAARAGRLRAHSPVLSRRADGH